MNYFKVFFYVWRNSFSSSEYYKDVIKAPFSFSLKFFIFFCFQLSIITTIFLGVKIFNPLNDFINRFPSTLGKVYPAELEIRIRNGVVTTNVNEPYFISVDQLERGIKEMEDVKGLKSDEIKNILVIDTNASVDDMKRYQTYALLSRNYISYYKDDGRIEIVPLEEVKNFTLNQNFVRNQLNKFIPLLNLVPVFLLPFLLIGSFLFFVFGQLFYFLFVALALFLGAKLISYPISFLKSYQIDLHLATIITPFFLLLSVLNINIQFPFLRLIIFTLIGLYILNNIKGSAPEPVKAKISRKRS